MLLLRRALAATSSRSTARTEGVCSQTSQQLSRDSHSRCASASLGRCHRLRPARPQTTVCRLTASSGAAAGGCTHCRAGTSPVLRCTLHGHWLRILMASALLLLVLGLGFSYWYCLLTAGPATSIQVSCVVSKCSLHCVAIRCDDGRCFTVL